MRLTLALSLAALLCAACTRPPADRTAGVQTMEDLLRLYGSDVSWVGLHAGDFVTPAGEPIPLLSPPFSAAPRLQRPDGDGLNVIPAWSGGSAAAYVVAEVWNDVPEVWVQPWWNFITAWDPANPGRNRLAGSSPVIAVGTESFFYSPFWEVISVEVPAETPPDRYTRGGDILEAGLVMHRLNPIFAPLGPGTFGTGIPEGAPAPIRPFSNAVVGRERPNEVWLDGRRVPYISYGATGFSWGDDLLVPEVPLFLFTSADGVTPALQIPSVIGTGPIGSNTPARTNLAGNPQFGGLTRPYTVRLPSTAGLFVPPSADSLRAALTSTTGLRAPQIHADLLGRLTGSDFDPHLLKIAADPDCFSDTPTTPATAAAKRLDFPTSCRFLDSQQAIESFLSAAALTKHEVLFTSPVVYFGGRRVGS